MSLCYLPHVQHLIKRKCGGGFLWSGKFSYAPNPFLALPLCSFHSSPAPHYSLTLSNYFQCQPNSFTAYHIYFSRRQNQRRLSFPPNHTDEPTLFLFSFPLLTISTQWLCDMLNSYLCIHHPIASTFKLCICQNGPFFVSQRLSYFH